MLHLKDLGFNYNLANSVVALFVLLFIVKSCNSYSNVFKLNLLNSNYSISIDTSALQIYYDNNRSYLKSFPYTIRFISKSTDLHVNIYIEDKKDRNIYLEIDDLSEAIGPVESQFVDYKWLTYVGKGNIVTKHGKIYFIEYINENTNIIQSEVLYDNRFIIQFIILNNDVNESNFKYMRKVRRFLESFIIYKK